MVAASFTEALRLRNLLGGKDSVAQVEGKIIMFHCNYYLNRQAYAHLRVTVISLPSRALLFSNLYKTDNSEWGVGAGIFGDTDHLAAFAQTTLSATIDKALSDPGFIAAIMNSNLTLAPAP